MHLLAVRWDVDPVIFSLGILSPRWYGVLFALGFVVGYYLMVGFFKREGRNPLAVDTLTIYMVLSTLVGARLGHVLFYQPEYYLANPLEIFMTWKGGLASHGAAVGILFALWLYGRRYPDQPFLWIVDRIVITVALAGAFIRLGNLMNSEIYGHQTDQPWGFIFVQAGETVPKHPTQIYEALSYLGVFAFLLWRYRRTEAATPHGLLLGWFLVLVFGARFVIEYWKEPQVAFEVGMIQDLGLNMGQLLSIPFVLLGAWLIWWANRRGAPAPVPPAAPRPAPKPAPAAAKRR